MWHNDNKYFYYGLLTGGIVGSIIWQIVKSILVVG